jgi:hypothetical protein
MLQKGCLVVGAEPPQPCVAESVTSAVVGWTPLIWIVRAALVIVILVGTYVFVVALLRYFRISVVRQMLNAPVPRLKGLGGKFAGFEATAEVGNADAVSVTEIARLDRRVDRAFELLDAVCALVEIDHTGGNAR